MLARVVLFGPVERMKVIMQTRHLTQYSNPRSDMPKSVPDLVGKIQFNQGLLSFYRGQTALMYLLACQQTFRFLAYDKLLNAMPFEGSTQKSLAASSLSAVALTTLLYPLDLIHTRMSTDMTKKQGLHNFERQKTMQQSQPTQKARLYSSVLDCVRKS